MDIRPQLYDRYVSGFKIENTALTEQALFHFFAWCDARYFPHLASLPKSVSILELGCGPGKLLRYLHHKRFTNVKGIDISEEQVSIASTQGLNAERADVFDYLASCSETFDCIIAIDFIEHFTKAELVRLFNSIRSAMKPDGTLLLQTVNGEGLFPHQIIHGDLTHETILSPGSMTQILALTGFSEMQFFECGPLASGLKGMLRTLGWKGIRFFANAVRKIETGKTQHVWTENFITIAKVRA